MPEDFVPSQDTELTQQHFYYSTQLIQSWGSWSVSVWFKGKVLVCLRKNILQSFQRRQQEYFYIWTYSLVPSLAMQKKCIWKAKFEGLFLKLLLQENDN